MRTITIPVHYEGILYVTIPAPKPMSVDEAIDEALKKFKSEAEEKNILYIEGSADVDEENSAEIEENGESTITAIYALDSF